MKEITVKTENGEFKYKMWQWYFVWFFVYFMGISVGVLITLTITLNP